MAKKIPELSELTTYATNDLLIIEDVSAGTTKKITWDNLIADNSITAAKVDGIDKSLLTTDSNPYKFRVRRAAALSLVSITWTKVVFDTEDFDTNNNFASGTYTAPVAGFYQFNARISSSHSIQIIIALYKNGSLYHRGGQDIGNGTSGVTLSEFVQSAASDTWEIYAFTEAAGTVETSAGIAPVFSGFLVSRT